MILISKVKVNFLYEVIHVSLPFCDLILFLRMCKLEYAIFFSLNLQYDLISMFGNWMITLF